MKKEDIENLVKFVETSEDSLDLLVNNVCRPAKDV